MIKYNPRTWFRHILSFHKTDTFWTFRYEFIIVAFYAVLIAFLKNNYLGQYGALFDQVTKFFSFIAFAFSLLLVFRINSAYDKWWEGRKLWGALVNNARNFAIKIKTFVPESEQEIKNELFELMAAFPSSLRYHLRDIYAVDELALSDKIKAVLSQKQHIPNALALEIYTRLKTLKNNGHISEEELLSLDKEAKSLTDILGACERIKNTPIPYSYNMFLKKLIFVFVMISPFAFVKSLHYWSIPFVMIIFYVFVGLEHISEEIEEPFGTDNNDLATDDLAEKISANIDEIKG